MSFGIDGLQSLIDLLWSDGYEVYGPQARNGVIEHDVLRSVDELPVGIGDEQEGGTYRLVGRNDHVRFGYAVGPQSWKDLLHPARTPVWTMTRTATGELDVRMHEADSPRRAFLGVRPCELAAIRTQDRVLLDGPHPDPHYEAQRTDTVMIVVNCGAPAATCFCPSMGTGPAATGHFDLAVTEVVLDRSDVQYVVEVGSERGASLIARVGTVVPSSDLVVESEAVIERAVEQMTRRLDTDDIQELLYRSLESARWDDVAERCLACGNCTLACPTCFCTDVVDVTDLSGDITDRWRVWDTCFSLEYSHLGPGPHRASTASRYRQWLVHKLASWVDQFGESGCVGCGRCITWCPVGIDLTAEIAQLRSDGSDS